MHAARRDDDGLLRVPDLLEARDEHSESELERLVAVLLRQFVPVLDEVRVRARWDRRRGGASLAQVRRTGLPVGEADDEGLPGREDVEARARIEARGAEERHERARRRERAGIAELERREERDRVGMPCEEDAV